MIYIGNFTKKLLFFDLFVLPLLHRQTNIMHSKAKYFQTACSKENFPMLHSIKFVETLLHCCLLTKTARVDYIELKTKQSLKRIKSQVRKQIHATSENSRRGQSCTLFSVLNSKNLPLLNGVAFNLS